MKNLKTLFVLLLATAMTTACKKKDDPETEPDKPAHVSVIHASPGTDELYFYVKGEKAHTTALTYGAFLTYKDFKAEKPEFSITRKGSNDTLTKTSFLIANDKSYTVFITDLPDKISFLIPEDNLTAPATDKAKVRFANLSPDAGALSLTTTGASAPLFISQNFKAVTSFIAIDPGAETNFEIREAGKTEVLTTLKVNIEKGKIYTIWAQGLKTGNNKLMLSMAKNN